jgi:polysaccharide biosynthesis protein PslH
MYGGSSRRIAADLKAISTAGISVRVLFPTKASKTALLQRGRESNMDFSTYFNLQNASILPQKIRLLLDEYGQLCSPFFLRRLHDTFRDAHLVFSHYPNFPLVNFVLGRRLPIVYISHNFEYGLMKKTTSNWLVHKITYLCEKTACKESVRVLCVSENDKLKLVETYHIPSEKVLVFPNTVDTEYFSQVRSQYDRLSERRRMGINPDAFLLMFSGRMDYRPNAEALHFILNDLVPEMKKSSRKFQLIVVGAQIPQACFQKKSENVFLFSDVPDMRRFFALADCMIVPLSTGSGTRIKILESFAARLPVISTAVGCEGIECGDRKHILVADLTAADFIQKAGLLRQDTELRQNLVSNAWELVTQNYSIQSISSRFQRLIQSIREEGVTRR